MKKLSEVMFTDLNGTRLSREPNNEEIVNKINEIVEYISIPEQKDSKFMYMVILVDDSITASSLNETFRHWENSDFKIQAFSTLSQMVGLRHGASRPTHVIDAIKDRSHPMFDNWYAECVLPTASSGVLIGSVEE